VNTRLRYILIFSRFFHKKKVKNREGGVKMPKMADFYLKYGGKWSKVVISKLEKVARNATEHTLRKGAETAGFQCSWAAITTQ
jgi:hypothetical protein